LRDVIGNRFCLCLHRPFALASPLVFDICYPWSLPSTRTVAVLTLESGSCVQDYTQCATVVTLMLTLWLNLNGDRFSQVRCRMMMMTLLMMMLMMLMPIMLMVDRC
jgi:hypothetical protein